MKHNSETDAITEIQEQIAQFIADRHWQKFQTVKNVCIAINIEATELMEILQWRTDRESEELTSEDLSRIRQELADVMINCLSLCNLTKINPLNAIRDKIEQNNIKYPKEIYQGRYNI